jgi:outer membrane biosynthesis protein TonB
MKKNEKNEKNKKMEKNEKNENEENRKRRKENSKMCIPIKDAVMKKNGNNVVESSPGTGTFIPHIPAANVNGNTIVATEANLEASLFISFDRLAISISICVI